MRKSLIVYTGIIFLCLNASTVCQIFYLADLLFPELTDNSFTASGSFINSDNQYDQPWISGKKRLVNSFTYDIYYKQWTNGHKDIDLSRLNFASFVILPNQSNGTYISAGLKKNLSSIHSETKHDRYINYKNSDEEIFFSVWSKLPIKHSRLFFQVSGINYTSDLSMSISGESQIAEHTTIRLGYDKNFKNYPYTIAYDSYKIKTQIPINKERAFANFENHYLDRVSGAFQISYSVSNNRVNRNINDYRIFSSGSSLTFQPSIKMKFSTKFLVGVQFRWINFQEKTDLFHDVLKFGHFGRLELKYNDILSFIRYNLNRASIFKLQYRQIDADINLRGHLDTWPFAEFIEQLIGAKVYLNTKASIQKRNFNITYSHNAFDRSGFELSVGYYHIKPDAEMISWNPAFLGMGVANRKYLSEDLQFVDAMRFGLAFAYRVRNISIGYSAHQFLPVKIAKASNSNDNDDTATNPDRKHVTSFGGSFHKISISLDL